MKIAVCLIVRNEEHNIAEWLAYHFAIGVDTLIVFNNRSTDATLDVLVAASGVRDVRVIAWPFSYNGMQDDAYKAACREFANEFDWIGFVDSDEFILLIQYDNVKDWLSTIHSDAAAIGLNWAMYGSSGHKTPPEGLIIESYMWRAQDTFGPNLHIKSFVRPGRVKRVLNPHFFEVDGQYVDPGGSPLTFRTTGHEGLTEQFGKSDVCRINHYFTRSQSDWERRLRRGGVTKRTWDDFATYDRNEIADENILRFVKRTRLEMSSFHHRSDPISSRTETAMSENQQPNVMIADIPSTSRQALAGNQFAPNEEIIGSSVQLEASPDGPEGDFDDKQFSSRFMPGNDVNHVRSARSGPIFNIVPKGNVANRMLQYMVALHVRSQVPALAISNVILPEWGIVHPAIPNDTEISKSVRHQRVNIGEIVDFIFKNPNSRIEFDSYGQFLSNYLPRSCYNDVFTATPSAGRTFREDQLVCSLRGEEVLTAVHPHYIQLPVDFYIDLVRETGLEPVFMGQVGDNSYCNALRRAFPQAMFVPSDGIVADFETIRKAVNIVPAISTFSWLAAWLSDAKQIFMPVAGLFHPLQSPDHDFLPFEDDRYRFYLFPISYSVPLSKIDEAHNAIRGLWHSIPAKALKEIVRCAPLYTRCLNDHLKVFSEEEYLKIHLDVAQAVTRGRLESGLEHYKTSGFREFRDPISFDRTWYAIRYPMAASEVGQGDYVDLLHHYVAVGYRRGYSPAGPDPQPKCHLFDRQELFDAYADRERAPEVHRSAEFIEGCLIPVVMTNLEQRLFRDFLQCSRRYLEFGSGGSTCLAACLVSDRVTSVDSSVMWLDSVRSACERQGKLRPELVHVDIGPLRELGYPADDSHRERWPAYYNVWNSMEDPDKIDTFLVDGRFRVACFLSILQHANADAVIMIHDFAIRPAYHVVNEFAREVARANNLSAFVRRPKNNHSRLISILHEHAFTPD